MEKRVNFKCFTVEIYLFSLNISTKSLYLKWTSPSLNEHAVLIGFIMGNGHIAKFFVD